jgi:hypothetical protein
MYSDFSSAETYSHMPSFITSITSMTDDENSLIRRV